MFKPLQIKRSSRFGSSYWEVFSVKANRIIQLFGDLQYDNWVLVESNPKIKSFCENPNVTNYVRYGKEREPFYDMWVQWDDFSEELIKVYRIKELSSTNNNFDNLKNIIKHQENWCIKKGYKFSVITENEIRNNTILLDNLKIIIAYTRNKSYAVEIDTRKIINAIQNGQNSIQSIEKYLLFLPTYKILEAFSWLIFSGIISSDIDIKPLNPNTKVWLKYD